MAFTIDGALRTQLIKLAPKLGVSDLQKLYNQAAMPETRDLAVAELKLLSSTAPKVFAKVVGELEKCSPQTAATLRELVRPDEKAKNEGRWAKPMVSYQKHQPLTAAEKKQIQDINQSEAERFFPDSKMLQNLYVRDRGGERLEPHEKLILQDGFTKL